MTPIQEEETGLYTKTTGKAAVAVKQYLDSESFPEFPGILSQVREKEIMMRMSSDSPGTERMKKLILERGERAQ